MRSTIMAEQVIMGVSGTDGKPKHRTQYRIWIRRRDRESGKRLGAENSHV
jgi:hypothetical protein